MWEEWFHLHKKALDEYGLWNQVASIRHADTRPDLSELLEGKGEIIFGKLEEQSLRAIEEDGADVILLGSTTMHQSYYYLKGRLLVPVVNPGLVMYKLCEMFLELVLSHCKKAFPKPEVPKEDDIQTHRSVRRITASFASTPKRDARVRRRHGHAVREGLGGGNMGTSACCRTVRDRKFLGE